MASVRTRVWIVLGAALIAGTAALLIALSMDVVPAHCDGPGGGFRCDFKRVLGWHMEPVVAEAIIMGIGAAAGAVFGLLFARATRRAVHA
jgi:hypothetical protein